MVKVAEFGLVFGLAVHMFGGIRLMAMEWLPWSDRQKTFAAASLVVSFLISGTFFLQTI
jgi:fumarate reductase subunit D